MKGHLRFRFHTIIYLAVADGTLLHTQKLFGLSLHHICQLCLQKIFELIFDVGHG